MDFGYAFYTSMISYGARTCCPTLRAYRREYTTHPLFLSFAHNFCTFNRNQQTYTYNVRGPEVLRPRVSCGCMSVCTCIFQRDAGDMVLNVRQVRFLLVCECSARGDTRWHRQLPHKEIITRPEFREIKKNTKREK
jgi:hypothetical protein